MGGVRPGSASLTPGAHLPPRVSFLGVRSLSLVLADFDTLFFFLVFIYCSFFCSTVICSPLLLGRIRIRARFRNQASFTETSRLI